MDLFEAIAARKSVRSFAAKPVEQAKLEKILQSAILAPSAGNLQAYEIFVVSKKESREALATAAFGQAFLAKAPVVIVLCANAQESSKKYGPRGQMYAVQDATIAGAYLQLCAAALGLATCWVGAFDKQQVSRVCSLGSGLRPVALIPLGYPAESPKRTTRRKLSDITHW